MRNNFIPFIIAVLIHGFIFIPMMINKHKDKASESNVSNPRQTTIDLSTFSVKRGATVGMGAPSKSKAVSDAGPSQTSGSTSSSAPAAGAAVESATIYTFAPDPVYPRLAREKNLEGRVKLKAYYNDQGHVEKVEVITSSGKSMLDNAATEALRKWTLNAKSPGDFEKTFEFKLNN